MINARIAPCVTRCRQTRHLPLNAGCSVRTTYPHLHCIHQGYSPLQTPLCGNSVCPERPVRNMRITHWRQRNRVFWCHGETLISATFQDTPFRTQQQQSHSNSPLSSSDETQPSCLLKSKGTSDTRRSSDAIPHRRDTQTPRRRTNCSGVGLGAQARGVRTMLCSLLCAQCFIPVVCGCIVRRLIDTTSGLIQRTFSGSSQIVWFEPPFRARYKKEIHSIDCEEFNYTRHKLQGATLGRGLRKGDQAIAKLHATCVHGGTRVA